MKKRVGLGLIMALIGMLMIVFLWVFGCLFVGGVAEGENIHGLEFNFYRNKCSNAELIVNQEIRSMLNDLSTAAALLRLAFQFCQVDGCNGSVLLRDSESLANETLSDMNFGIRKLEIIDDIKASLETICPQTVSCADIIQLAAREAILAGLIRIGHCRNFARCPGPIQDPTLSPSFTTMPQVICSSPSLSDIAFATNDGTTFVLDNSYFLDVLNGRGLLKIDSEMSRDLRTLPFVVEFARNQQWFFNRFSAAFMKLSSYNTGDEGEIRRDCRFVNN